jgi:long-chain acyl-CoA synthetase
VVQRFLTQTKAQYWTGYGQSETTGIVTLLNAMEKPGSTGKVVPMLEMRIVDDTGEDIPVGTPGEIAVKGLLVFLGYWRDEGATKYASRFGWHHTGDVGKVDKEGYLYFLGRKPEKDLIKTGGENVYPAEVEHILRQIPEVADVCVIGVPDEKWGEAVKAVVELTKGSSLTANQLIQAVASNIASYKKPQYVDFVDELPRMENEDVDREAVKADHS